MLLFFADDALAASDFSDYRESERGLQNRFKIPCPKLRELRSSLVTLVKFPKNWQITHFQIGALIKMHQINHAIRYILQKYGDTKHYIQLSINQRKNRRTSVFGPKAR